MAAEPLSNPTAIEDASCSAFDRTVMAPTAGAEPTIVPTVALLMKAIVARSMAVLTIVAPPAAPLSPVAMAMPRPKAPEYE